MRFARGFKPFLAAPGALLLAFSVPAFAQFGGMAAGPTTVGVVTLENADVPVTTTIPGRAVAYESVDIRPRVGGTISEIVYQPGRRIEAGDVLFRIESETYEADVAAARASVALAEAAAAAAQAPVTRYEALEGTGVTTETLETARVSALQSAADLSSARATLQSAELDLQRTQITSPISGYATVPTVSVGALVTANQTDALASVTRLDPIYVDIEESSRRIGEMRARIDAGAVQPGERLGLSLTLETGETYPTEGEMVSPGASVSTSTGTATFRIRFDNPERRIMPGQFLRVDVTLGTMQAVLVPQMATSRDSAGQLTAFVVADGVAEQRVLTEEGSYQNAWAVTEGVVAGETLIVDGLQNLRAGAEVAPVEVVIADNGVVTRADGASEAFGQQAVPADAPASGN